MKRVGNLFNKIFSKNNLRLAYLEARKAKRNKKSVFEFEKHLGENLEQLYDDIHTGNYEVSPYFKFTIHEPKERIIYAPNFRDMIIQHAIYKIIYPIFDKTFIEQSYACRKGKGTHKCSFQAQKYLRNSDKNSFFLQMDIRKFFYRIQKSILEKFITLKIKCKKTLKIIFMFIPNEVGLPIGNLLSQLFALIYLNPLDHFIKRILKIKFYVRYVDDFICFNLTKEVCTEVKKKIEKFLKEKFKLEFSKFVIKKSNSECNFVGYRTWRFFKMIRKYSLRKLKRCIRKRKIDSIISLIGHSKNTILKIKEIILNINPLIFNKLPKRVKGEI